MSELVPYLLHFSGTPLQQVLVFWATGLVLGLALLPLSVLVGRRFLDGGWALSRILGVAICGWTAWCLSSFHLLPAGTWIAWTIPAALGALVWMLPGFRRETITRYQTPSRLRWALGSELVFLSGLTFWAFVRSLFPDIHGLEKFMDHGFLVSCLRNPWAPPPDPWFAGASINYYYLGQYLAAFQVRLSGLSAGVGYNVALASIAGSLSSLGFILVASLTGAIRRARPLASAFAGTVAALLLCFGGNLHSALFGIVWPLSARLLPFLPPAPSFQYSDATRFIGYFPPTADKTIHEFAAYSFAVGDLHAHLCALPLALALLLVLVDRGLSGRTARSRPDMAWWPEDLSLPHLAVAGLLLALLLGANSWDFPVYLGICTLLGLSSRIRNLARRPLHVLLEAARETSLCACLGILMALPFLLRFHPFARGIALARHHSPLWQLLILWGHIALPAALLFLLLALLLVRRAGGWRRALHLVAALPSCDRTILVLLISVAGLVLVPELVRVRDIYASDYQRANTMFKMAFQAYALGHLTLAYMAFRLPGLAKGRWTRILATLLPASMICASLTFTILALPASCAPPPDEAPLGLDGEAYLRISYPDGAKALDWIRDHARAGDVMLEADGDSYSNYGVLSSYSGVPTVLGWFVHEWLWRGSRPMVAARSLAISSLYNASTEKEARIVLDRFHVRYLVVGRLERRRFPKLQESLLLSLGRVVFRSGEISLVEVRPAGS